MKTLFTLYSASCVIVLSFFVFFRIPWELLPFSDGVNLMCVGGFLLAAAAVYTLYLRVSVVFNPEWFHVSRSGFWVLVIAGVGTLLLIGGALITFWPELYVPAIEQGALPFGIMIVSLFWLALIFMMGFLAFGMIAKTTLHLRAAYFIAALTDALIGLVCIALTGVFFSLFLEVLNDIAVRISVPTQWKAIWIFIVALTAAGIVHGIREKPGRSIKTSKTAEKDG